MAVIITGHGDDYRLGLKDNQPTLHQLAKKLVYLPDQWVSDREKGHSRIERRRPTRVDLDQDISPFPSAQQLIRSAREWIEEKSNELISETRYLITSLERDLKRRSSRANHSRPLVGGEQESLETRH